MQRFVSVLSCIFSVFLLLGCDANDGKISVTGSASWEGTPIAEGSILFMPVGDPGSSDAAAIKGGNFTVKTSPGKKQVQIFAYTPGKMVESPTGGTSQSRNQIIPDKYNTQSTISLDVAPDMAPLKYDLQ